MSYTFLTIVCVIPWVLGVCNLTLPYSSFLWQQPGYGIQGPNTPIPPGFYVMGPPGALSERVLFYFVFVANIAQLVLSIAYTVFNNQVTQLWREYEWRSYYRKERNQEQQLPQNISGHVQHDSSNCLIACRL